MGEDCSVTADACEERIQHAAMPNGGLPVLGNRACNVNNDGNRCIASIDPKRGPMYDCICNAEKWSADSSLPYDNCLKQVSRCDQIICVRGQCYDSRDGNERARENELSIIRQRYEPPQSLPCLIKTMAKQEEYTAYEAVLSTTKREVAHTAYSRGTG
ncbi:unnamed protein product [Schistocephalus solidus]|uniref:EB domain-containing protein n=1 Tax=Schistocephalus solidus TaxID=70667 RepID=A0A183S9Z7_SCHSO|nr:unnamed protein product [Schistocephalus solidus]